MAAIFLPLLFLWTFISVLGQDEAKDDEIMDVNSEVPSKPLNLTLLEVWDKWALISWQHPDYQNGVLQGYKVYLHHANTTDVSTTDNNSSSIRFNLTALTPYTDYTVRVRAYTSKHEGNFSEPLTLRTDVGGPGAPVIANLSCQDENTLKIQWRRPSTYYGAIDYYYIHYRSVSDDSYDQLPVQTTAERIDHNFELPNLTSELVYEVKIQGSVRSNQKSGVEYKGRFSEPRKVFLESNCHLKMIWNAHAAETSFGEVSAGMVAGVVCAALALVFAVAALVLWRKYFQRSYYYLYNPAHNNKGADATAVEWDCELGSDGSKVAIPVHLFPSHVASLHADGDIGFSKEYEAIQDMVSEKNYTADLSQQPDNKPKNRYMNIVAYDHSRVPLSPLPGQKKDTLEYVNANFIDGYQKSRAYIGTQGPLPSTFDEFWRMIWEQNVAMIVMITNLVERGRKKCDMYWPEEGMEVYGVIQVRLVKEIVLATYTIRHFAIKHLKVKCKKNRDVEKLVYQYHYTHWPDHGTPEHPLPIISFVKKSSAANPEDAGPIIVHCSAGVGRTGTYIVLDAMLKQIRTKGSVSVCGFLKHIRSQRNHLVQTEEQYIFTHDALLDAIDSGDTNISADNLTSYIHTLQCGDSNDTSNEAHHLTHQFKLITRFEPDPLETSAALQEYNSTKNRDTKVLPMDSGRVHLTPKPGVEGSDYINATWLLGFTKLQEFILTQHPMEQTEADFWQMVWDHNAQCIILLSETDSQEFPPFWPEGKRDDLEYENFKVKWVTSVEVSEGVRTSEFVVQSLQDDYELSVRMAHAGGWPHCCEHDFNKVFQLLKLVHGWCEERQNGPAVVVDRFGGNEAAMFCCLMTLYRQWMFENHIDVYMYAKLYHHKRPHIWSQDDILFLYRAMESVVSSSPKTPSTPNGHLPSNGYAVKVSDGSADRISVVGTESKRSSEQTV